ncbi:MAG: TolC family protein [Deltaproteobacteria bacterium]|nr:TolC family protein [Deltaproteobacteria bacterium]
MLNLRASVLFFTVILAASPAVAVEGQRVELPFRQGVRMLLENNLQVKSSMLDPGIAGARVLSASGAFDPEAFASFKRSDSSRPLSARSSVAAGGLKSIKSESYSFNAGIEGTSGLGTEYRFEVRDDWTADNFSGFEYEYESFTGVSVRQPLLKGFGSAASLGLKVALKDKEATEHRFRQALSSALSEYADSWWALMSARDSLEVKKESLQLAEVLFDVNRKKLAAGSLSRLELVLTESAVAARREDLLAAQKAVEDSQRRLKELVAGDAYAIRNDEIVPVGEGTLRPASSSVDEAVSAALSARPDYLEMKAALEKERLVLKYSADQRWPLVDLEASYGFNGLGDSFSNSFNNLDANPEWSVGVLFSYPLGNRAAKGDLEAARLQSRQALLKLKRLEQEIVLGLSAAMRNLEIGLSRLEAADEAVRLAAETLEAEEKKLEAGRSTTYNVLKIQEDLLLAKLKKLDAVSGYNASLVAFYMEKGTLIEELGVRITDIEEVE